MVTSPGRHPRSPGSTPLEEGGPAHDADQTAVETANQARRARALGPRIEVIRTEGDANRIRRASSRPRASRAKLGPVHDKRIKIAVEPRHRSTGEANAAVIELLAKQTRRREECRRRGRRRGIAAQDHARHRRRRGENCKPLIGANVICARGVAAGATASADRSAVTAALLVAVAGLFRPSVGTLNVFARHPHRARPCSTVSRR